MKNISIAMIVASIVIALGLAVHGSLSRERRFTAVSNHGTDLTGRIMILDKDTGACCIFNCAGKSTGWVKE